MTELTHYTKIDTLIKYILPTQKLRLSNLVNLNDPYENIWKHNKIFGYQSKCGEEASDEYRQEYLDHIEKIGEKIKVACFSSSKHPKRHSSRPINQNMRMWAQYGQSHEGACITFNRDKLINSIEPDSLIEIEHVIYSETMISNHSLSHNIDEFKEQKKALNDFLDEKSFAALKARPYCIFSKLNDWADESEYRIAIWDSKNEYSYVDIKSSIEKITFGLYTNTELIRIVKLLYPQLKLYKLEFKYNAIHEIPAQEIN